MVASASTFRIPRPLPLQREEREVIEPRKTMTVSKWAEEHRVLSQKTTERHGPWSNDLVPFAVEIMDSLSDPSIRQVTERKCSQAAGTEISLNFMGWCIDEAPAPLLIVMPREDDVKRRLATRVRPLFESCERLLRHIGNDPENLNTGKETELDNMILYLAWAGSAAALADNPVCNIILDEVGKFPTKSGNEADPVSLAKKRLRTFHLRSKLFVLSTPVLEKDLIDREYKRGDQRQWWAKCVHCGEHHVLKWANVKIDKTTDEKFFPKEDYEAGGCARYICPLCKKPWTEQQRWRAVRNGRWAPKGCTVDKQGRIVGEVRTTTHRSYHVSALMLYPGFTSIDQLAHDWVEAQEAKAGGDFGPLQDFINSELGEPYENREKPPLSEQNLRLHIGSVPLGVVPIGVQMLTAGFDVQIDHVWMLILGWGWLSECWIIDVHRIETGDTSLIKNYDPVRDALAMTLPLAEDSKKHMMIRKSGIDAGFNTEVVQDFCRSCTSADIVPVLGDDHVRSMYRQEKLPGDLLRYHLNTEAYKDALWTFGKSSMSGPGYLHLPAIRKERADDRATVDELIQHLMAEEKKTIKNKKGKERIGWDKVESSRPNHLWDCLVYGFAAGELAGARTLRDPNAPMPTRRRRIGTMKNYAPRSN